MPVRGPKHPRNFLKRHVSRPISNGVPEVPFELIEHNDAYEIRKYTKLVLAGTSNGSFRTLYAYISGSNKAKSGECYKIPMTAPVYDIYGHEGENATMAFAMPAEIKEVPEPTDAMVKIMEIEEVIVAAAFLSGSPSKEDAETAADELRAKLVGYKGGKTTWLARFDPPWVPGFWRKNEVMVKVKKVAA
jgi:hypothetical protein